MSPPGASTCPFAFYFGGGPPPQFGWRRMKNSVSNGYLFSVTRKVKVAACPGGSAAPVKVTASPSLSRARSKLSWLKRSEHGNVSGFSQGVLSKEGGAYRASVPTFFP